MASYRHFFDILKLLKENEWVSVDIKEETEHYKTIQDMKQLGLIMTAEWKGEIDHITIRKQGVTFYNFLINKGGFKS